MAIDRAAPHESRSDVWAALDNEQDKTHGEQLSYVLYNSVYIGTLITSSYVRPLHEVCIKSSKFMSQSEEEQLRDPHKFEFFQDAWENLYHTHVNGETRDWLRDMNVLYRVEEDGQQSEVYVTDRAQEYEKLFEPFAGKLAEEMLAHDEMFHDKSQMAKSLVPRPLWMQTVQMVRVLEHLKRIVFAKSDKMLKFSLGRDCTFSQDSPLLPCPRNKSLTRSVEIILPCFLALEEIKMPASPHGMSHGLMASVPAFSSVVAQDLGKINVPRVLSQFHDMANPMHPMTEGVLTTCEYDFFKYLLWKYAGFDFWSVWDLVEEENQSAVVDWFETSSSSSIYRINTLFYQTQHYLHRGRSCSCYVSSSH
jgi:hypothetical protein